MNNWVPLNLPEENETVLITFKNSAGTHVGEATFREGQFYYVAETDHGRYEEVFSCILAWMKMPKPFSGV